jgi:hypothetical protein
VSQSEAAAVNLLQWVVAASLYCYCAVMGFVVFSVCRCKCTLLVLTCSTAATAPCEHTDCIDPCMLHICRAVLQ